MQVPGSFRGIQGTGAVDFSFVEPISNNPGLIVERVAPQAISSTKRKILQQIDLQAYFTRSLELKVNWALLNNGCINSNEICQS